MEIPAPLITGSIIYAFLAGILLLGVTGALMIGAMSKDNAS